VLFALSHAFRVSFVCFLALVHMLRGACELRVIFSLAHVFRVSFVCSLALLHVFRGACELCALLSFRAWVWDQVYICILHLAFMYHIMLASFYHRLHLYHML
jgi:hypothetical protein